MKRINVLIIVLLTLSAWMSSIRVLAQENLLPSGIDESTLEEEIEKYVSDNIETTAGMAYAVFTTNQEIASGYYGFADKENEIKVDKNTVFE